MSSGEHGYNHVLPHISCQHPNLSQSLGVTISLGDCFWDILGNKSYRTRVGIIIGLELDRASQILFYCRRWISGFIIWHLFRLIALWRWYSFWYFFHCHMYYSQGFTSISPRLVESTVFHPFHTFLPKLFFRTSAAGSPNDFMNSPLQVLEREYIFPDFLQSWFSLVNLNDLNDVIVRVIDLDRLVEWNLQKRVILDILESSNQKLSPSFDTYPSEYFGGALLLLFLIKVAHEWFYNKLCIGIR